MATLKPPSPLSIFHRIIEPVREAAREASYTIAVHGSLARDIDLIAVPWAKDCWPADELAKYVWLRVRTVLNLPAPTLQQRAVWDNTAKKTPGPHGRLWRAIYFDDDCQGAYIDLAIVPPSIAPVPADQAKKQ